VFIGKANFHLVKIQTIFNSEDEYKSKSAIIDRQNSCVKYLGLKK